MNVCYFVPALSVAVLCVYESYVHFMFFYISVVDNIFC